MWGLLSALLLLLLDSPSLSQSLDTMSIRPSPPARTTLESLTGAPELRLVEVPREDDAPAVELVPAACRCLLGVLPVLLLPLLLTGELRALLTGAAVALEDEEEVIEPCCLPLLDFFWGDADPLRVLLAMDRLALWDDLVLL